MHRNIRRTLLALGVTLIVLPAAVSDGHELTPQQAKVVTSHADPGRNNLWEEWPRSRSTLRTGSAARRWCS